MPKKVTFKHEAQQKILQGARIVAEAVGSTLGPKANNVAIARPFGSPSVLHDGVSVAKEIELECPEEDLGAKLIIEAAQKTNDKAGDGTTTATILTYAIADEAIKIITAGGNAMKIRQGIEMACKDIVKELKLLAKPIKTDDEIKQIATISSQDTEIGLLIHSAIKKLGQDCIIAVEEKNGSGMSIEYKQGMQFDKGYLMDYFITNPTTKEAVADDPYILITDIKITDKDTFVDWAANLEKLYGDEFNDGKPKLPSSIVIITPEMSGIGLATLVSNQIQGTQHSLVVMSPQFGDAQKDILEDLATATGGTFVSASKGMSLSTTKLSDYGQAKKVVSTRNSTVIIDGQGTDKSIAKHVDTLKVTLEKEPSVFIQEKLKERIAKLTSGIAVINAGGSTDMEMREKKERCIDAIEATKAAIEEGIVPGGQVAYLTVIKNIHQDMGLITDGDFDDIVIGYDLVRKAIQEPFRVLMNNSGYDAGQMMEKLRNVDSLSKISNQGIDATDGQIKNVVKAGIIDPVKVCRVALENAVSTAGAIITTNTIITEIPKYDHNSGNNPQS